METKKSAKTKVRAKKKIVKAKQIKKPLRPAKKKTKKSKPKTALLRKSAKKSAKKSARSPKFRRTKFGKAKPIGKITHFFGHIRVAIVKFNQKVSAGTELHFKGATTDFKETAKSMQYNHVPIAVAPKGKQIGIKVKKRVREGDLVYRAE